MVACGMALFDRFCQGQRQVGSFAMGLASGTQWLDWWYSDSATMAGCKTTGQFSGLKCRTFQGGLFEYLFGFNPILHSALGGPNLTVDCKFWRIF